MPLAVGRIGQRSAILGVGESFFARLASDAAIVDTTTKCREQALRCGGQRKGSFVWLESPYPESIRWLSEPRVSCVFLAHLLLHCESQRRRDEAMDRKVRGVSSICAKSRVLIIVDHVGMKGRLQNGNSLFVFPYVRRSTRHRTTPS